MVVDTERVQRAFNLYSWGVPITTIAEYVGIDQATIHKYKKENEWDKIQSQDLKFATENTLKARRAKNAMIINGGIDLVARRIADGSIKATLGDLPNLIKVQRLEQGETTENVGMAANVKIDEAYKQFMEEEEKATGVHVVGTVFAVTLIENVGLSDGLLSRKDFVRVLHDSARVKASLSL